MSDRPNGHDLLVIAREELMKRLLPALPAESRYEALMIANAMAIAAREFETGLANDRRELQGLRRLLGEEKSTPVADEDTLQQSLQVLRKMLCEVIRAGRFDGGQTGDSALNQHLAATARDKVMISNPKLLVAKASK